MSRSSSPLPFDLVVPEGPGSLSDRLGVAIMSEIQAGRLVSGDPLPSTRTLAAATGIARSTVVLVYENLAAQGVLLTQPGSRTVVGPAPAAWPHRVRHLLGTAPTDDEIWRPTDRPIYDLMPGYPDAELINARAWSRAWRKAERAARQSGPGDLELWGVQRRDPQASLRVQLSHHLRRDRGISAHPDDIFVFPSLYVAVPAIIEALGLSGLTAAVEDPGNLAIPKVLTQAGCSVRHVRVDADGMVVEELRGDEAIVYVTPTHQLPTGVALKSDRRASLLEFAMRTGTVIIEDDFDGQFHADGGPSQPLRGTPGAEDVVIFVGTTNRILSHQLKITWIVVPSRLRQQFRDQHLDRGNHVCGVSTTALAEFIRSGALTRHIAHSQRIYTARRRAFVDACADSVLPVPLRSTGSGLYSTVALESSVDDVAMARDLATTGLACLPLSPFFSPGSDAGRGSGLICGHARLPVDLAAPAVRTIADLLSLDRPDDLDL